MSRVELPATIDFLLGPVRPCSYIQGRQSRNAMALLPPDPVAAAEALTGYTQFGYRRSENLVYRPLCPSCKACVPVRVVAAEFQPSKTQARILKRNADMHATLEDVSPNRELYALFSDYVFNRHADSSMKLTSYKEFSLMLKNSSGAAKLLLLRDGETVKGAMLVDCVDDGYSAVYSWFDPKETKRSLGSQMIMTLIGMAVTNNLPYIYLGYKIAGVPNMAYKANYQPLEMLCGNEWVREAPALS